MVDSCFSVVIVQLSFYYFSDTLHQSMQLHNHNISPSQGGSNPQENTLYSRIYHFHSGVQNPYDFLTMCIVISHLSKLRMRVRVFVYILQKCPSRPGIHLIQRTQCFLQIKSLDLSIQSIQYTEHVYDLLIGITTRSSCDLPSTPTRSTLQS